MYWYIVLLLLLGVSVALAWRLSRAHRDLDRVEMENQKLAQDRQRLFEFMHLMTEALGEGLSRQELQQRIVHASILSTGALSACIFEQTERNTMRAIAVEGLFPPHRPLTEAARGKFATRARFIEEVLTSEEFPAGEGMVGRVARTRQGELLADARLDPRMVRHDDPALSVRSVIVVPLVFRDRFFGVLAVANPEGGELFSASDFALMQSLAEQAALALHNAEFLHLLIERRQLDLDLSIASGIQQMLLPREMPRLDGLEIDARYTPAQKVGGDLYDVFSLSPTRLGVAIADVSGKGIPASLLMAICRTNFRQIAQRHDSPARVLSELNRALALDIRAGLYITMVYAIIDVEVGEVTMARAGHELPLMVRRDVARGIGDARFIGSDGMALGLAGPELFSRTIADHIETFAAGDLLVLYTDGVTEAPNEDQKEFSGARLADVVCSRHQARPCEINDAILDNVHRFEGEGGRRDDLTLLTVKRRR
jgi:phosphoserine phosphatase RsbU/P